MLTRYANKLRGMDWRKEDGSERRAAQYDSSIEDFMEDFRDDANYFGEMKSASSALEMFGGDEFIKGQKNSADLKARIQMAKNTYQMMQERAWAPGGTKEMRFDTQYDKMSNRTWIKRLLLKTKKWF